SQTKIRQGPRLPPPPVPRRLGMTRDPRAQMARVEPGGSPSQDASGELPVAAEEWK
ncbi:hypothetical protein HK104_000471, partial [Borealophlyctis nickersoniae]